MKFINAFQKMGLTLAAIMLSAAALVYSIQPAKADQPTVTSSTGKYMMSESGFVYNNTLLYHILVWNTETGESKLYNFNKSTKQFSKTSYQLPSSPLY